MIGGEGRLGGSYRRACTRCESVAQLNHLTLLYYPHCPHNHVLPTHQLRKRRAVQPLPCHEHRVVEQRGGHRAHLHTYGYSLHTYGCSLHTYGYSLHTYGCSLHT